MKAILKEHGTTKQYILTLVPENASDEAVLKSFAEQTTRAHILNCRGFKYISREVEFLVQHTGDSR